MIDVSIRQFASVWSELEAARFGKNGFGGDTAEIYIYRVMPRCPAFEREEVPLTRPWRDESILRASRALAQICALFEESHPDLAVLVADVRDEPLAVEYLRQHPVEHRVHLRVVEKKAADAAREDGWLA